MTNHPNRNWRRAMHTSADAHLAGYADGRLSALPTRSRSNEPR